MGINRKDIDKLFTGRTVISSIYMDDITGKRHELLTPVYLAGTLKGIVMVDVNQII